MATETGYREWLVYQLALEGSLRVARSFQEEDEMPEGIRTSVVRESRRVCFGVVQVWFDRGRSATCIEGLRRVKRMVATVQVWLELAIAAGAIPAGEGEQMYEFYGDLLEELGGWLQLAMEWKIPFGQSEAELVAGDSGSGGARDE